MTLSIVPFKGDGGVIVDPGRAKEVLDVLVADYFGHKRLFAYTHRIDAPQTVYRPEEMVIGSLEHVRWLFFAAMTDRREISAMVYKGHRELWANHAEALYNNPLSKDLEQLQLEDLLRKAGFGMPRTAARDWLQCSSTLFTLLHGDPRLMYAGRSIDDIVRMKNAKWKLSGFGPKILSLLAVFYAELEMITMPTDAFPVDVHVQRFALSTGILKIEKKTSNTHLERILRPLLANICHERGWSVVEVSHAIWFLGNRLCTGCARSSLAEVFCPSRSFCGGPFETKEYFTRGAWDHTAQSPVGSLRQFGLPLIEAGLFST
jgi:endonuclease III